MSEFWLVVVSSLVLASLYVWTSIQHQTDRQQDVETLLSGNKASVWIVLPLFLLFCSPFVYLLLGNQDKQLQLIDAQHLLSQITNRQPQISSAALKKSSQISLEDLVLSLRVACAQQPENGELWFTLAETYFQLGMAELADQAISRAIRLGDRPHWLVAKAQILSFRSNATDMQKSIRLLQRALQIEPRHESAMLMLGFIYLRQQQYEPAINIWKQLKSILASAGKNTDMLSKQISFAENKLKNSQ